MADSKDQIEKATQIVGAKHPAKGRLLANLSQVSKEDRARAGITDEQANAMVSSNQPQPKGVQVSRGPWQENDKSDVVEQIRVIDHDTNRVLFAGSAEDFEDLKRAIAKGGK